MHFSELRFPVDADVRDRLDRLEIPFNEFGVDPYGISKAYLGPFFQGLKFFFRHYFSVESQGIENVPAHGRAMLIGNHSGGFAIDGAMVIASQFFEMNPPRLAQGMAEKFLNKLPFASQITNRLGHLTGLPEHAERLLADDRLLMVFPEGARGTAKLYKERYSLVGFGSGFMRLAMRMKTPIVPLAFLGGGEALPTIANAYSLGRVLGVPYIPVTPWGLAVPIPAKLEICYSAPMHFEGDGSEDDEVVHGYVEQVRERISGLIERGRRRRRGEP
ncbi:MAG: acyltransferase family protein [Polyangiaceae bacterium]|nr:acyltransferase family protein [Polyangiaceae bacterium]